MISRPFVDEKGAVAFSTASRNIRRCFNASLVLARWKISLKKELIFTFKIIPDFLQGQAREFIIDILKRRAEQIFGYLRHHNTATNTVEYEQITSGYEKHLHRSGMEGYYPNLNDEAW